MQVNCTTAVTAQLDAKFHKDIFFEFSNKIEQIKDYKIV